MRMYMWTPYDGHSRPVGPFTLLQIVGMSGVPVSSQEFDDIANMDVGDQYCIPEQPSYPNTPEQKQLGDFTRVE